MKISIQLPELAQQCMIERERKRSSLKKEERKSDKIYFPIEKCEENLDKEIKIVGKESEDKNVNI